MGARWMQGEPGMALGFPVLTAQGVETFDMVGLSAGNVVRAADETWGGSLALTQASFALKFLGVSNQRKVAGKAFIFGNSLGNLNEIKMMVIRGPGAIIEFDCASATFAVGDLVGPAKDTGNALLNQTVVAVATYDLAIGRVVQAVTSSLKVRVELMSRFIPESIVH